MNKHLLMALFAGSLSIGAYAEDGAATMTIAGASDPITIEVASISRITFDGTKMLIDKADGNIEMDIADVTNIVFDAQVSAEESIEADFAEDFTVKFDYGVMTLSVCSGKTVDVAIYNAYGQRIAGAAGIKGEWSMSLTDLQPGVYIIRANNKTFKFSR